MVAKTTEDRMLDDMAAFLQRRYAMDVVEVVDYEDTTRQDGYCETCRYEYAAVLMYYRTSTGEIREFEYYGDFGELIRELNSI